jgi:hypothetical protein
MEVECPDMAVKFTAQASKLLPLKWRHHHIEKGITRVLVERCSC